MSRWTERGALWPWLVALGVAAFLAAAAGTPARATRGAQTTADEPQYLLTALSLAEDGDLDISDELAAGRWRAFHEAQLPEQTKNLGGGRRLSPHDPLLPVLLALPVAVGGWVGAKIAMSVLAGLLAAATAWVAVRRLRLRRPVGIGVVGVFAVSAPLAAYGTQIYPELPAALLVVTAAGALMGPLRRGGITAVALSVVALPWLAVKYAPVAAALAGLLLVALWRGGRRTAVAGVTGGLAVAGLAYVLAHLALYGGLTAYAAGDHFVGGELTAVGTQPSYLGRARRLVGLLVDRHFGLAAWQPAWLLAVPAVAMVARRREVGWQVLAAPLAAGWLTATFVALTMQGWWFPGRQVVVVLPLAVLAIAAAAERLPALRLWLAVLGALGVWSYGWLVGAAALGRITWIFDFYRVPDPWYRAWSALLPNYLDVSGGTWIRHGTWLLLLAATALWTNAMDSGGGVFARGTRTAARLRSRGAATATGAARGRTALVDGAHPGAIVSGARGQGQRQDRHSSGRAEAEAGHTEILRKRRDLRN